MTAAYPACGLWSARQTAIVRPAPPKPLCCSRCLYRIGPHVDDGDRCPECGARVDVDRSQPGGALTLRPPKACHECRDPIASRLRSTDRCPERAAWIGRPFIEEGTPSAPGVPLAAARGRE